MPETTTAIERFWVPDWLPGQRAWFEYHCWESPESNDAEVWYHSHQQVTVLERHVNDGAGMSWAGRMEAGQPYTYTVRFDDGLEWGVFEDELTNDPNDWYRPDPPRTCRVTRHA